MALSGSVCTNYIWTLENKTKGETLTNAGGYVSGSEETWTNTLLTTTVMVNYAMFAAWDGGDQLTFTLTVQDATSPFYGKSYSIDIVAESMGKYDLNIVPETIEPSLTFTGPLCAGLSPSAAEITITNVSEYSGYSWSITPAAAGLSIGTPAASCVVTADASVGPGTYSVQLMKGGMPEGDPVNVIVSGAPTFDIIPLLADGGNGIVCKTGSVGTSLTLNATNLGSGYSYSLNGAAPVTSPSFSGITTAGSYTVKATSSTGCPAEASVSVIERSVPMPAVAAVANPDVCTVDAGSTALSVNSPDPAYTYTWTGLGLSSTSGSTVDVAHASVATTAAGNSYTVTANDGKCNSAPSAPTSLKGHSMSLSVAPPSSLVTEGVSLTVTATAGSTPARPSGDYTYNWTQTGMAITGGQGTASITTEAITGTSTYTVEVSDGYCTLSQTVTYTVDAATVWNITATDVQVCSGLTQAVTAGITGTPAVALNNLTWSAPTITPVPPASAGGLVLGAKTGSNANPSWSIGAGSVPGRYNVELEVSDGVVTKTETVTVTVWGVPTLDDPTVFSTGNCVGTQTVLQVNGQPATTALDNSGDLDYRWINATEIPGNDSRAQATLAAGDNTYRVKVVDGNGCESAEKSVTTTGHEVTVTAQLDGVSGSTSVPWGTEADLMAVVATTDPATGIVSYEWNNTARINGDYQSAAAKTLPLTANGSFTVTVKDQYGCTKSSTVSYTVSGTEMTVSAHDAYICQFSTTQKVSCTVSGGSGAGAVTYEWMGSVPNLFVDNEVQEPLINPAILPGTYTATVEVKRGPQTVTSATINIQVGAQPQLTGIATFHNGNPVPDGGTVTPNSQVTVIATGSNLSAGTQYVWTPPAMIDHLSSDKLEMTSVPLSSNAYPYVFKLVMRNEDGQCEVSNQISVEVTGTEFAINMPDTNFCQGSVAIIQSTGFVTGGKKPYQTYTWSCSNPNFSWSNHSTTSILVDPSTPAGVYTVRLTVRDGAGSELWDEFTVTIDALPTITLTPPPGVDRNKQVGDQVTLTANATPASTVLTWNPVAPAPYVPGTLTGAGTASVGTGVFQPAHAGNSYQYRVQAKNGACTLDSVLTINVSASANPITIGAIADVEVCDGVSSIPLSATASGGSASSNLRYAWSVISGPAGGLTLSSSNGPNITATPASLNAVGDYVVRVTVSDVGPNPAAPQFEEFNVYIHAKPELYSLTADNLTTGATGVTTVERGEAVKLNASAGPSSAILTYSWTEQAGSNTLLATTGASVNTQPLTANTTYSLIVKNSNQCEVRQNITITVTEPATGAVLSLSLQKECADSGKDMVLRMDASGATSYSFTLRRNGDPLFRQDYTGAGPNWTYNISLGDQDTYWVQNFKAYRNGVEISQTTVSPAQLEALFYTTPVITIAEGNVQTVCEDAMMTLTASSQLSGTTFTWDNNVTNGQPFLVEGSKLYTVTAESDKGCKATSTVNVTLAPKPNVTVSATPQVICLGESVVLQAGGSATEFTWNNGQTVAMFTETPNVGGILRYVVTGKELLNGCTDTASVTVRVNEPPMIVAASKPERSIAIGKNVAYGIRATGENLTYRWQRWTGASWMDLYNSATDTPGVLGAQTDSLTLTGVPRSWDNTRLRCVVTNPCGTADTTFTLYVKECFDILDIEWDMCEGIRPETNPSRPIDGWYCPGTKISICARLIMDEPGVELGEAIYKWTVDGLSTTDGRWDEMTFISSSSVLSWVPPADWQDNITVAVCAYIDGACDTVCKSYLRLKAAPFEEMRWKLHTSLDPSNGFCPGDTVRIWANTQGSSGKNATFHWYNDIFDLHTDMSPRNELLTELDDDMLVKEIRLRLDQQDTWVKVVMTPSPEVCTEEPTYEKQVFLKLNPSVSPELEIWTEDTLACINDEIYLEARWKNAGADPTFQWTRSIGFPYWNLGDEYNTTTILDDKDMWIKCELFPSAEVCYSGDPLVDVIRITALTNPEVSIYADLEHRVAGDEILVESDLSKMAVKNPVYTWFVNNLMMVGENREELISDMFRQGDKIQLGVRGGQICQNMVMSNVLTIDYDNSERDTLIVIYKGEQIRNLDMFRLRDTDKEFFIAPNGYTGAGSAYMGLDGKFNYVPDANFSGMDKVTYIVVHKYTGTMETGYIYVEVKDQEKFLIPNIITPNGDGLNDTWILNFLQDFPDHIVTVYNRNGKVVLRARNYQNDWDGSGQGNSGYVAYFNLPSGVYTYVIDLGNREVLKGWLEIRKDMNRGRYSR